MSVCVLCAGLIWTGCSDSGGSGASTAEGGDVGETGFGEGGTSGESGDSTGSFGDKDAETASDALETGDDVSTEETGIDAETGEDVPEGETGEDVPEGETGEDVPTEETGEDVPTEETGEDVPTEETGEDVPTEETGEDVETGGEVGFGEPIAVSSITPYESGWLHGLSVDDLGRVSVLWSGEDPADGSDKLLLSRSNSEVTGFQIASVVATVVGGAAAGPDEGDVLVDDEEHLFLWRTKPGGANGPSSIWFRRAQLPDLIGNDVLVRQGAPGVSLYRPHFARKSLTKICAFWQSNQDVMMSCSVDGGLVFSVPMQVDPPGMNCTQSDALFDFNGQLVVVYQGKPAGETKAQIYYQTSTDDGVSFTPPIELSTLDAGSGKHFDPSLTLGLMHVHVGWHETAPGGVALGWTVRSADGVTWEDPLQFQDMGEAVIVRAGKGSTVYATGKVPLINILLPTAAFTMSEDAGLSWSVPVELELPDMTYVIDHDIVADRKKGLLHSVWWEFHSPNGISLDITERDMWVATIDP